jgi:hypothetical protein
VEQGGPLTPFDVSTILIVLGDINVNIAKIRRLLEEAVDGEEDREDDA